MPSGDVLRWSLSREMVDFRGFQTHWAHRLEVYVPVIRLGPAA
jgi:hypothetical protein